MEHPDFSFRQALQRLDAAGLLLKVEDEVDTDLELTSVLFKQPERAMLFKNVAGYNTRVVGNFLGIQRAPISYEVKDRTRLFQIPKIIDGAVTPVPGKNSDDDTVISNSQYWIAPEIIVAKSDKSRMRAFGRNWNFAGRSAEICKLDWRGP